MGLQAKQVFEQWLIAKIENPDGAEGVFESLLESKPELAEVLRRLRADYEFAERALEDLGADPAEEEKIRPLLDALPREVEPRYEVVRRIAETSWNLVEEVRDLRLPRRLARKTMDVRVDRPLSAGARRALLRLLREAAVASRLQHPSILSPSDFGIDARHRPFIAMPLVDGEHFGRVLARADESLPARLRVLVTVCEAVSYAHSLGILHRDLKPENVMVGPFGEVRVVDWGLARSFREADETWLDATTGTSFVTTIDGAVVGTPAYMSPEQAAGLALGPATDQYSLGAMLYEALAGHRPFEDQLETAESDAWIAAARDGVVTPLDGEDAPAELVSICRRAMARQVSDRYDSVRALTEDLGAYLDTRIVKAHSGGPMLVVRKWVQRNRRLAAVIAGAAMLLILGLSSFLWREIQNAQSIARVNGSLRDSQDVLEARLYERNIEFVQRMLDDGKDRGEAFAVLRECPEHLRHFEWRYLNRILDTSARAFGSSAAQAVAVDVRETVVAIGSGTRIVLYDLESGRERWSVAADRVRKLAFSPKGDRIVVGNEFGIYVVSVDDGSRLTNVGTPRGYCYDLSFARNGTLVGCVLSGRAFLLDATTLRVIQELVASRPVFQIAVSPNGRLAAIADRRSECAVFATESGRRQFVLPAIGSGATMLEFDLLGTRLVGGSGRGQICTARIREQRREERFVLPGQRPHPQAVDPTGTWLVHGHGSSVRLRSMTHNQHVAQGNGHRGLIRDLVFLPRRQAVVSTSEDGAPRLWEMHRGQCWRAFRGLKNEVMSVCSSPDSERVAAIDDRGVVLVWNLKGAPRPTRIRTRARGVSTLAWSAHGLAVIGRQGRFAEVFDPATRALLWSRELPDVPSDRAWEGRTLLVSGSFGLIRVHRDESRAREHLHTSATRLIAVSADCRVVFAERGLECYRLDSAAVRWRFELEWAPYGLVQSAATRRVYCTDHMGVLRCIDLDDGTLVWERKAHNRFGRAAITPDGARVATCGWDGSVKLWHAATGRQLMALEPDGHPLLTISFSGDGGVLAVGSVSGLTHAWDVRAEAR